MQLKLLPPAPLPTVLFTLAYPAPPSSLPLPAAYAGLLKLIVEENLLDSDNNILDRVDGPLRRGAGVGVAAAVGGTGAGSLTPHALDRATWIAAVLSEVVFDLSGEDEDGAGADPAADADVDAQPAGETKTVRVRCRYVDGREVAWALAVPTAASAGPMPAPAALPATASDAEKESAACYAALLSVLADVNESAAAGERERRERERRHTYHERCAEGAYPFVPAAKAGAGAFERYDRYPVPVGDKEREKEKERERERERKAKAVRRQTVHGAGMQRSWSFEERPVHRREEDEHEDGRRRRSLDEGVVGLGPEEGVVEVRKGKGRKREEGKGKHKKQRSLLASLVALASFITPKSSHSRSRSPSPPPSAPEQPQPFLQPPSQSSSRAPSPTPHVVHPQLTIAPVQPSEPQLTSSDLRRRARATLVDVFRRHVLSTLKTPLALPPRAPAPRAPRRVRSAESERRLRSIASVGSALTARSSSRSLSDASVRVQCVSRSPSVTVLRSYESTVGVFRGRFDAEPGAPGAEDDEEDEDEEEVPFGRENEGGYVTWVTRSLLRRVEVEMREMRAVVRGMNARAARSMGAHVGGMRMQRSVGSRMGFSPVEGPLLASSPPIAGLAGVVGEWDAPPRATLVDEPPPFCGAFDDSFEIEDAEGSGDEGPMEDVPLEDGDNAEEAETTSTGTSTETDGSSVHTPSEATSFDQVQIQSPSTPPLQEPERGEYFVGVDASAMQPSSVDFDAPPLSSSPPRRPVLTKQPPMPRKHSPPPLPSQMQPPRASSPPFRPSLSVTVSPSQSPASPSALPLAAYTALSGERVRLLSILARLSSQHAAAQADEKQLLNVLEAKSRRRAWSNRAFMGSAHVRFVALATPDRRSPLSTATPITAASLRKDTSDAAREHLEGLIGGGGKPKKRGLVVTTAESNILRLFPVCEEDEDDGGRARGEGAGDRAARGAAPGDVALCAPVAPAPAPGAGPADDAALSDAEDGVLGALDFPPLTRQPSRRCSVPVRPRERTRSMSMSAVQASSAGPLLPAPVTMGLPPAAVPVLPVAASYPGTYPQFLPAPYSRPSTSTDNLLCPDASMEMMEFGMVDAQTKVELFDVYSGDEDEDDEEEGEMMLGGQMDAFALALDLPTAQGTPPFVNARKRRECESDGWLPA